MMDRIAVEPAVEMFMITRARHGALERIVYCNPDRRSAKQVAEALSLRAWAWSRPIFDCW